MTIQQDADAVFWGCTQYARYKSGRGQMSLFDQPVTAAKPVAEAPQEAAPSPVEAKPPASVEPSVEPPMPSPHQSRPAWTPKPPPPAHMLPDEDVILKALEEHGGKITGNDLAAKYGWDPTHVRMALHELGQSDKAVKVSDWEYAPLSSVATQSIPIDVQPDVHIHGGKPIERGITPRRVAASKRALQKERDKSPLLAEQIAAEQPTPEQRIKEVDEGASKWAEGLNEFSRKQASDAQKQLDRLPPEERAVLVHKWNNSAVPKTSEYFAEFVHDAMKKRQERSISDADVFDSAVSPAAKPPKPEAEQPSSAAMKDVAPHMMTLADYRRSELTGKMDNGAPVIDISHMTRAEKEFVGGIRNAFVYEPTHGQTLVEFPKGWSLDKARQEIDEAMQGDPGMDLSRDTHRAAVQKALDAGATVPEEVLADYPGMVPAHKQSGSPEDAAAKKKEAQRQKKNAAARARSDAMRSLGMKRTRSGGWE